MADIKNIPLNEKLIVSNPKINQNFQNLNTELTDHINSASAHPAQNIPYSGAIIGVENTKQALDKLKQEINDLILGGDDTDPNTKAEVEVARGGHDTLGDRLDASDEHLAEIAEELGTHESTIATTATLGHVRADGITVHSLGGILSAETIVRVGSFSRDMSLPSGNQSIAGLGFQPKSILFFASKGTATQTASNGVDNGLSRFANFLRSEGWAADSTSSIVLVDGPGNLQYAKVVSFDPDGFTIAWNKSGSPTGVVYVGYFVLK